MNPVTIQDEDVKFGKLVQNSVVKILSWKDVLRPHRFGICLSEFAGIASFLYYEYLIWNDIIYTKEDGVWMRTHMTKENVK